MKILQEETKNLFSPSGQSTDFSLPLESGPGPGFSSTFEYESRRGLRNPIQDSFHYPDSRGSFALFGSENRDHSYNPPASNFTYSSQSPYSVYTSPGSDQKSNDSDPGGLDSASASPNQRNQNEMQTRDSASSEGSPVNRTETSEGNDEDGEESMSSSDRERLSREGIQANVWNKNIPSSTGERPTGEELISDKRKLQAQKSESGAQDSGSHWGLDGKDKSRLHSMNGEEGESSKNQKILSGGSHSGSDISRSLGNKRGESGETEDQKTGKNLTTKELLAKRNQGDPDSSRMIREKGNEAIAAAEEALGLPSSQADRKRDAKSSKDILGKDSKSEENGNSRLQIINESGKREFSAPLDRSEKPSKAELVRDQIRSEIKSEKLKTDPEAQNPDSKESPIGQSNLGTSSGNGFSSGKDQDHSLHSPKLDSLKNLSGKKSEDTSESAPKPGISREEWKANMDRMVQSARISILSQGKSQAEIRLNPEELGKMILKISVNQDKVDGKILVESEAIKALLQNDLSNLREDLRANGLNLGSLQIDVDLNSQQEFGNQWRQSDAVENPGFESERKIEYEDTVREKNKSNPDSLLDVVA
jgi:flagellar hook-length control protein FliK